MAKVNGAALDIGVDRRETPENTPPISHARAQDLPPKYLAATYRGGDASPLREEVNPPERQVSALTTGLGLSGGQSLDRPCRAAIHADILACDIARPLRGKESHRGRNLLGFAIALHRHA